MAKARSYGSYLKVPELLRLQQTLSEPSHHDEVLFIVIHQVYELWFKQMLHEVDEVVRCLSASDTRRATRLCRRLIEIQRVLIQQIPVLETMTPPDFMEFREHLNPASGFQSYQFRALEFRSGLKDPRFLTMHQFDPDATAMLEEALSAMSVKDAWEAHLRSRGLDYPPAAEGATEGQSPTGGSATAGAKRPGEPAVTAVQSAAGPVTTGASSARPTPGPDEAANQRRMATLLKVYTDRKDLYDLYILAEALIEYDENFMLWRQHHILMVERMIGMKHGTGGSEGVGYLRTTLGRKCFPDLWAVRTHISGASDYGR